mgnify:CR=1 FL=1
MKQADVQEPLQHSNAIVSGHHWDQVVDHHSKGLLALIEGVKAANAYLLSNDWRDRYRAKTLAFQAGYHACMLDAARGVLKDYAAPVIPDEVVGHRLLEEQWSLGYGVTHMKLMEKPQGDLF